MKRVTLWLGTIPGFYYRSSDGHFHWECMCDISRLCIPPEAGPRERRSDLAAMEEFINKDPCSCQI